TQATNWGQDAAPQAASWAQDAATSAQDAATQAASWGQDAASQGVSWGQDAASTAQDAASQAASWGQDAASQAASWGQDAAGGAVGAAGTAAGAIGGAVGGGPSFPTGQSPAPQGGNPWGGQMPGYPAAPGAMQYPAGYPNAAPAMRYASWGKRAIAIIVDGLVLSIPLGALTAVFGGFESSSGSDGASFSISGPGPLLGLVVGLLYYSILNGRGQTLGKMAMGIRVADKNTGESIGIGRALGRYLVGLVLSALCFVPYVLNVLWPLWDSNNQALHDKAIGSVVLDKG
ncbi:MAG: RDD family protein, partial [Acidimicrobiia bacterium]|nr:RDD family protein [Acidimicrobiia bacterium]